MRIELLNALLHLTLKQQAETTADIHFLLFLQTPGLLRADMNE